jgi:membrane glycosyltransferase
LVEPLGDGMTIFQRNPLVGDDIPTGLAMPDQTLTAPFRDSRAPGIRTDSATLCLRTLTLLVPMGVTLGLAWLSLGWFALDGRLTFGEIALTCVTGFAGFWMVLSVATALLGLFWRPTPQPQPHHGLRLAILLPMYGEPAQTTMGNAVALLAALRSGGLHRFSLHILSDTRDPARALVEDAVAAALRREHPGLSIHYRRRAQNVDFKSGNIRDWVQTHGQPYDAMLILDADSIMGPKTVIKMADALAAEPGLGLLQTVPRVLPGHTVWQAMQSFASEVYGINMGRGFAMWTGAEGNFLGHNALVRVRAFAASAGLPHLPGRAPRGGVILSHDFVEAALLRRAGWGVRMMAGAEDSFEDTPETLLGYLRRDRRWCQGNMQHLRLILMPGLHPVSRFHLLQGAMAYLASVWWLALLLLWALPVQNGMTPDVFVASPYLPNWPMLPPVTQGAIAALVGLLLMAPKLLGIIGHIRDQGLALTDAPRFVVMVLAEISLSALLAPLQMVHQVRAVLRTLAGFDGGWMPHQTGASGLAQLVRFHATETALGLVLLGLAATGYVSAWLLPVAISLCLSVPLAALIQLPLAVFQRPTNQRLAT